MEDPLNVLCVAFENNCLLMSANGIFDLGMVNISEKIFENNNLNEEEKKEKV